MATDEEQIRTLVERWAEAVHTGDLSGVLADHATDIVMYDVPPPYEGVRGIDAYRETWPPFFDWQTHGASFEIESLDVTAGGEVAFAHALLRCGTAEELAGDPLTRLRVTLGLRKDEGRWVVAHEHHSFPITDAGRDDTAEREVRRLYQRWFDHTAAKDLDAMMAAVADDVVSYEQDERLQHVGIESVREVCERGLDVSAEATVSWDVPDLEVLVREDLKVAWGLDHIQVEHADGRNLENWSRGTRVFQRRDGAWLLIHEHVSVPHDPETGEAKTGLRP